ncbi:hypothetical protein D3C87_1754310 [compost metagenome]
MAGMGRGDIDGVDMGIGKQRIVTMDDARAGKGVSKAGLVRIAGGDSLELTRAGMGNAVRKGLGDGARADNAPADRLFGRHEILVLTCVLGKGFSAGDCPDCRKEMPCGRKDRPSAGHDWRRLAIPAAR